MAKKDTKTNKKENNKNKKSFWKDFKAELKKVVWPTPKQLLNNTTAVISIVLITAAIVFVLDIAFESVNKHGVNRIKEVIGTSNTVSENTTSSEETTEETQEDNIIVDETNNENDAEEQTTENQENLETDAENQAE